MRIQSEDSVRGRGVEVDRGPGWSGKSGDEGTYLSGVIHQSPVSVGSLFRTRQRRDGVRMSQW